MLVLNRHLKTRFTSLGIRVTYKPILKVAFNRGTEDYVKFHLFHLNRKTFKILIFLLLPLMLKWLDILEAVLKFVSP